MEMASPPASLIEQSSKSDLSTMPDSQDVTDSSRNSTSSSVIDAGVPITVISNVTDDSENDSKSEDRNTHVSSEESHQSVSLEKSTENTAVIGKVSLDTGENLQGNEESNEVSLTITDVRSLEHELCPNENYPQAFELSQSDGHEEGDRHQDISKRETDNVDIQDKTVIQDETSNENVDKCDFHETMVSNMDSSVSVSAKNVEEYVINEIGEPVEETPVDQEELLMITDVRSLSEERNDESHNIEHQAQQNTELGGQLETSKDLEGVNKTKGGQMEELGDINDEIKDNSDQQSKQQEYINERSVNDRTGGDSGSNTSALSTIPLSDSTDVSGTQTASISTSVDIGLPVIVSDSYQTLTCPVQPTSTCSSSETVRQSNEGMTSITGQTSVCTVNSTAASPLTSTSTENSLPVISNIFSIKQEPAEDGSYGGMSSTTSVAATQAGNSRASISSVINKLHCKQINQPVVASNTKTVVNPVYNLNALYKINKTAPGKIGSNVHKIKCVYPADMQKIQNNPNIVQLTTMDSMQNMVRTSTGNQRVMSVNPRQVAMVTSTAGKWMPQFYNNFTGVNNPVPQAVKVMCTGPQPKRIMADSNSNRRFILPRSQQVTGYPGKQAHSSVTSPTPVSGFNIKPTARVCNERKDSSSFINIQTVGVEKITELISRKNPIPMFKPSPVPDNLIETKSKKTFPCYECGDSFYFEKSLKIHMNRCSMRLSYKCTKCDALRNFTNKCQLLSHLRCHSNTQTTLAVPIHIKSDSINIKTVYDEIGVDKKFEWYDEQKCEIEKNWEHCVVCGTAYKGIAQQAQHFSTCDSDVPHRCDKCYMCLPNKCSLELHRKLHDIMKNDMVSEDLICPECGLFFARENSDNFCRHMELHCFHLSRLWVWSCPKCEKTCDTEDEIREHLLSSLENYYKCVDCPMALKTIQSFFLHYKVKHGNLSEPTDHVKMIYRCHLCDTLIDDRSFLVTHLDEHSKKYSQSGCFIFSCRLCPKRTASVVEMKHHFNRCHSRFTYESRKCIACQTSYNNAVDLFLHAMVFHQELSSTTKDKAQFCKCGLVCTNDKMLSQHSCHYKMMMAKRYKCPICQLNFGSTTGKYSHIQYHKHNKEYICVTCDRIGFKSYQEFRSHEIACIESKKMTDRGHKEHKLMSNKQKGKAKKIVKESTGSEDSSNSDCEREENFGKVRLNLKGVNQEKRFIDKGETFKCDKCSQTFTRMSKLNDHKDAEHGQHACHLCGMLYQSQSKLKMHLIINHKGIKPVYNCWVCRARKIEKSYTDISTLERHLGQKHRMKTWDRSKIVPEWPDTELKGVSPEPLETLNEKSTSEDEPPMKKLKVEGESEFKCAKCVFKCESKQDFHAHIAGHHTENTVQCLECGLCFTVMPSLQRHLFMVHKLRDFSSYVKENNIQAPKELDSLDFIEREETVPEPSEESSEEETGNPMECKVCYKEFDSEYALKKHIRNHGMAFIKRSRRSNAQNNSSNRAVGETETADVCEISKDAESPCKKAKQDCTRSSPDSEVTSALVNGGSSENGAKEGLKIKLSLSDRKENGEQPVKWEVKEISSTR